MTEKFDDAIDRAAQAMTDVEPPPGLRGRVFARLDEPVPAILTWPRLVAAGAAIAVLIAALVTFRAPDRSTESTVATHEAPASVPAIEPQQMPAPDRLPPAGTPSAGSGPRPWRSNLLPRQQALTTSEPEEQSIVAAMATDEAIDTVPPLDEIAPIAVSRALETPPIEIVEIVLVPFDIPALEVRPLSTDATVR